jgi:uncharacterized membrane protein HdeD (DUF308 family)
LFLALGLGLCVLGICALGSVFITTLATILFIGILLVGGGVVQLATAVLARTGRAFFVHVLVGILYLVLGALMIEQPEKMARGLTLMIAAAFLVGGLFRIVFSLGSEHFPGWAWVLGNGIVTLLMGVLIWREWPESAVWVIGLFVGIDLLSAGATWVLLALALRRTRPAPDGPLMPPSEPS